MTEFLSDTRKLLDHFPRGVKVQASRVIDWLITELKLTVEAEDVARCVLYSLHDLMYLEYHHELFTADWIMFLPTPEKKAL